MRLVVAGQLERLVRGGVCEFEGLLGGWRSGEGDGVKVLLRIVWL